MRKNRPLLAGVAEVDITPPLGLPMWGYAARKEPAQGVFDPLYARVLILQSGGTRLGLVVLDLGRTFGSVSFARLRTMVKERCDVRYLLLSATHTHSGPVIRDEYPDNAVPAWELEMLEKIAHAVQVACNSLQEVRIGIGYGKAFIGHNRLRLEPDGGVTWFSSNPNRIPTAPVDPMVTVIRLDTTDGTPLAVLMCHACHPVVFDAINLNYSADFPGTAVQMVREAFGGKPICFFLQGATGDINPYYAHLRPLEEQMRWKDWTGMRLGEEVVRVAANLRTEVWQQAGIQVVEEQIRLQPRYQLSALRPALEGMGQDFARWFAPRLKQTHKVPLVTALIGRQLAIMTIPGEPFISFQIDWRERCPVPHSLLLGYTNGYFGYFPTIRAAAHGGYGAAGPTAWLEVGAGERMVNQALVRVYEMLGQLKKVP